MHSVVAFAVLFAAVASPRPTAGEISLDELVEQADVVVVGRSVRVVIDGEGEHERYAVIEVLQSLKGAVEAREKLTIPHSNYIGGGRITAVDATFLLFLSRAKDGSYHRSHRAGILPVSYSKQRPFIRKRSFEGVLTIPSELTKTLRQQHCIGCPYESHEVVFISDLQTYFKSRSEPQ